MPIDTTSVAPRSPVASSRISNKSTKPLPGVDGRSTWSRRRRDLIASFTAELGRPPRERDKVLITDRPVRAAARSDRQRRDCGRRRPDPAKQRRDEAADRTWLRQAQAAGL